MLTVSHLTARYEGHLALQDINLSIDSGELLVVLGPSGCGKTTLLNLIAGFLPAESGSIMLDGKAVTGPGALVPDAVLDPALGVRNRETLRRLAWLAEGRLRDRVSPS